MKNNQMNTNTVTARKAYISAMLLGTLMASTSAFAQSIDYGGLEMIYGEPVTTSATGKPQRASEAPANMIIVTAD